jgi:hypothetical protein
MGMLVLHIILAVGGVLSAFVSNVVYPHSRWRWLTLFCLVGLFTTGTALLIANPALAQSTKFFCNMSVVGILLVVEALSFVLISPQMQLHIRTVSVASWVWIFMVAVLAPAYPYVYFALGYIAFLAITIAAVHSKHLFIAATR